ncbi:MAG: hypothetical protein ACE5JJ_06265 [Nitrospinota bacterium]
MPEAAYLVDIRMGAEIGLLLLAGAWYIRSYYRRMRERDRLNRAIAQKRTARQRHEANLRRAQQSLGTFQGRLLPQQIKLLSQLEEEVWGREKALEDTGLPGKVKFLREVREHWEKHPDADRFRGSDWRAWDDAP